MWVIVLSTSFNIYAQNLVTNGSFEQYSQCPNAISQITYANVWLRPNSSSPDYYNTCSTAQATSVPGNLYCYQFPRTGNAYAGIFNFIPASPWDPNFYYREYIETQLITPLVAGTCYYFEMYASLMDRSYYMAPDMGVYFSDTLMDGFINAQILGYTPQIENPVTNTFDTLNWTLISGYYTAHGGENYIVIGSYHVDSMTTFSVYNSSATFGSYLLVDDVSLTICTGLEEFNKLDITVAPNPFTDKLSITTNNTEPYELLLTDRTGRQVLKQNLQGNATVQTGYLNKGIYFATVRKKEKVVTVKVLKR